MMRRRRAVTECPRHQDVLDAIAAGRLDARREPSLFRHAVECPPCGDVAVVARALTQEAESASSEAVVPAADLIWVRAQMRARADAAVAASRPVALAQALGIACGIGAALAVIGTTAWWFRSWVAWLGSAAALVVSGASSLEMASLAARGVLLALGVWLLIAPVAVYLAATED